MYASVALPFAKQFFSFIFFSLSFPFFGETAQSRGSKLRLMVTEFPLSALIWLAESWPGSNTPGLA